MSWLDQYPEGARPMVQQLLGCEWGRSLGYDIDTTRCEDRATSIVALHAPGQAEYVEVKLCDEHRAVVDCESDAHECVPGCDHEAAVR